jgi:hypothetical protein
MSLNDKHALFGKSAPKSGQAASKSAIESHAEAPAPVKPKVLATVGAGLQTTTMSAAAAEKKRAEARDWEERGQKNLKTSIFQWSPDYLAAAPCFENASNAYATLGDMKKAIDNLVLAADYNEKANCLTTAAFTYSKVAALCSVRPKTCDCRYIFADFLFLYVRAQMISAKQLCITHKQPICMA